MIERLVAATLTRASTHGHPLTCHIVKDRANVHEKHPQQTQHPQAADFDDIGHTMVWQIAE